MVLPPLSFSLSALSQDSVRGRRDVYGDIRWRTYDQVQISRRYGHRWQNRCLACKTIGAKKNT